jgi:two-component system, chemotaxis family, chemotaxis protein CheY
LNLVASRRDLKEALVRALVIDDSRAIRSILGSIMKDLGFEVSDAKHGLEALDRLKQNGPIDLALVDWNMPEMNGFEFITAVRANPEYKDLRLVMVTTETEMSQVVKAIEAGANEYIMKPFTKEMIVDKLRLLGMNV